MGPRSGVAPPTSAAGFSWRAETLPRVAHETCIVRHTGNITCIYVLFYRSVTLLYFMGCLLSVSVSSRGRAVIQGPRTVFCQDAVPAEVLCSGTSPSLTTNSSPPPGKLFTASWTFIGFPHFLLPSSALLHLSGSSQICCKPVPTPRGICS